MSSYLRNLFGGQGQSSKSHGEPRSRSRPPAVTYNYKSSKPATSDSIPPRAAGVKRSHSATRSHVPSPLRDVTNEGSHPALQRSNTSRSHSKSKNASSSQYSGPGAGELYPDFVRPYVYIVPRPTLPNSVSKRTIYAYPNQLAHWLLCLSSSWDPFCRLPATTFPFCISLSHIKEDAVTPCSKEQQHLGWHWHDEQCWSYVYHHLHHLS